MIVGLEGRFIQDHFPGIGRYAFQLARLLPALAPQDEWVIYYDPTAPNARFDLDTLRARNVRLVEARVGVFSLRQHGLMCALSQRDRLDVYHTPHYAMPYTLPCPAVASIHDLTPWLLPETLPQRHLRWAFAGLTRLTVWRARALLASSQATRDDLVRVMGAEAARVHTVSLGVDASLGPAEPEVVAALRRRLQLEGPYLLYLGSNKPHKNLVRLVEAWGMLSAAERSQARLVIAGQWDARYPQARLRAQDLGLDDAVQFLGPVAEEDLTALYSGALAFVFPSLYEGFGLPVLEAMACGVPVAAARCSSLPEVVGDAGLLFDPESVPSIAETLACLLHDAEQRRSLALLGYLRARTLSWERTAAGTLEVLRLVVAGARR